MVSSITITNDFQNAVEPTESIIQKPEQGVLASSFQPDGLKTNIVRNSGFEEFYPNGEIKGDFNKATSQHRIIYSNYSINVINGSYAAYIESQGGKYGMASSTLQQHVSQIETPYLSEGLSLEFFWNLHEIHDLTSGSNFHITVNTQSTTSSRVYLHYYLSYSNLFNPTNTSTEGFFLLNETVGETHRFNRNISTDYQSVPEFDIPDITRNIDYLYINLESAQDTTGMTRLLLDDFELDNSTYFEYIVNGDFELGNGTAWSADNSSPGYITSSNDCVEGSYSVNLTTSVIENDHDSITLFYDYLGVSENIFTNTPDDLIVKFDWKYDDNATLEATEWATFAITCVNQSGSYFLYFNIGRDESSMPTNSTRNSFFNISGYNTRNDWVHSEIDIFKYYNASGLKDVTLSVFTFQVQSRGTKGAYSNLLVDNFEIITYPSGSPGFEEQWWGDFQTSFSGWYKQNVEPGEVSSSVDVMEGDCACNLTTVEDNDCRILRSTYCEIDKTMEMDFWWKVDSMQTSAESYAYVEFEFDDDYALNYLLASSDTYTRPSNTSEFLSLYADEFNTTKQWIHFSRNFTDDLEILNTDIQWNLTEIRFEISAGSSNVTTLILDAVHIMDGNPPVYSSVSGIVNPINYYQVQNITIDVSDVRPGIGEVMVYYRIDGGEWQVVMANFETPFYKAAIPSMPFGEVEFYVNATDLCGKSAIGDNGGFYYTYSVIDTIDPVITFESPSNESEVTTAVWIEVDIEDGGGIGCVEFYQNGSLLLNDTTAPYRFYWYANELALGPYKISVIAKDMAGNSAEKYLILTVVSDTTTTTTTTTTTDTSTTTTTTTPTTQNQDTLLLLIIAGIGAAAVVIVIVIGFQKRRQ